MDLQAASHRARPHRVSVIHCARVTAVYAMRDASRHAREPLSYFTTRPVQGAVLISHINHMLSLLVVADLRPLHTCCRVVGPKDAEEGQ